MPILDKDTNIVFPHFTVLNASAGSGKTYTLTERFVQFLLSDKIPNNRLQNILAITFSNNASKEMKGKVLDWLKSLCFEERKTVEELTQIVSMEKSSLVKKAGEIIDTLLGHYADFQVRTIDSFMVAVFRSSAIDFGYAPDFEILMNSDPVLEYAFNLCLKEVREGSLESGIFEEMVRIMNENRKGEGSYLWDPSTVLQEEVKRIYRKIASTGRSVKIGDYSGPIEESKRKISQELEAIESLIVDGEKDGLERNGNSTFGTLLSLVGGGRFVDLIGRGLKNAPAKKPRKAEENLQTAYEAILDRWKEVGRLVEEFTSLHARSYYASYLKLYATLSTTTEEVKRREGKVFIEDINKRLSEYLRADIVPDIYCRVGETIFHFLIDEFQDTSPIQWQNLFPLIENSLSQGGSLFVVGDTKQAIYGFRDADYTIMKRFESENPFPSAKYKVLELDTNYRSLPRILEFSERVFKETAVEKEEYRPAAERSGLTRYVQRPKTAGERQGYVQVELVDKDEEDFPERLKLLERIQELQARGYALRDIAILTAKNEEVVNVTSWLSEGDIPSISYSSLDIRRRKVTGEIFSLLRFLDSPPDDLSFATFLLGDIFGGNLQKDRIGITRQHLQEFLFGNRRNAPLYKAFQEGFAGLWEEYFSRLYRSVGYLPLYDLVTEVFRVFRVFQIVEEEEATFVKVLEAVKEFEGSGFNSLRGFIDYGDEDKMGGPDWEIDVPKGVNAVRAMTIHKAKGLEFPVVIVLLYGTSSRGFDYVVAEEGDQIVLLKLDQKIVASAPQFRGPYEEEVLKEQVNLLNSLYVSFTRAEEELYVIGVRKGDGKTPRPLNLLPGHEFPPSAKPERTVRTPLQPERTALLLHPVEARPSSAAFDSRGKLALEDRRRGEFIHRVLSLIEYGEEAAGDRLGSMILRVSDEMRVEYDPEEMKGIVRGILAHGEIGEFFERRPGRVVRREEEVVNEEGRLFRIDRLVLDDGRAVVIDWKTGREREAESQHEAQMKNYLRILEAIYPERNREGMIVYVEQGEVKRVD